MKLDKINMIEVVPAFMQEDATVRGLCASGNVILQWLANQVEKIDFDKNLSLWDEGTLDYIASCIGIPWYSELDKKEAKLNVIKNSDKVFWSYGTTAAVEQVVTDVIGSGKVNEWYEYGGQHNHFRLSTTNIIDEQKSSRVLELVNYAKKAQSVMDDMSKEIIKDNNVYSAFGHIITKVISILPK